MRPVTDTIGKQQSVGETFSPRPEEMRIHIFDRGEITQHRDAARNDLFELITDQSLHFGELWEPGTQH
jgi:hypothetical protein